MSDRRGRRSRAAKEEKVCQMRLEFRQAVQRRKLKLRKKWRSMELDIVCGQAQFAPSKAATAVQSEEHSVLEVSLGDPIHGKRRFKLPKRAGTRRDATSGNV